MAEGAASSSTATWASWWQITPPHGGLSAASDSEFAAVPVATGYTSTGRSKTSDSFSTSSALRRSSP